MNPSSPILRICIGLGVLTASILVLADLVGLIPGTTSVSLESRIQQCETLAAQASVAADRKDLRGFRTLLEVAIRRDPELQSVGLRGPDERLLVATRDHRAAWMPERETGSSPTHVRLPLYQRGRPWATLEVRFHPVSMAGKRPWEQPLFQLIVLVSVLGFVGNGLYMRRTLRHLDPSAVVPARVQATLDVMAEGVLILNPDEQIVLANEAFAKRLNRPTSSLLGLDVSELSWSGAGPARITPELPWRVALREGVSETNVPLQLRSPDEEAHMFLVNASPVLDGFDRPTGAIVTFDDITELERKTLELEKALSLLEKSQDEIQLHNDELTVLAKSDPLTGISNRRAFMEHVEELFASVSTSGGELSCIMADIDHFKRVNDTHGHSMGDEVIQRVADELTAQVGSSEAVCRYGGEEFCIILKDTPIAAAAEVAERIRNKITLPAFARVPVTVSFGVSSSRSRPGTLAELIDQADEALFASKHGGRNQVSRFDEIPASS